MTASGDDVPAPARALRLTFSFRGDDVRLVAQQAIDVVTPPTDPVEGFERQQGFWAELQAPDGRTLYRRVLRDPAAGDVEVFGPAAERTVARAPVEQVQGVFSVLVPDVPEADTVVLRSSSAAAGPAASPAQRSARAQAMPALEWARFSLRRGNGEDRR